MAVRIESFLSLLEMKTHKYRPTYINCIEIILALQDYRQEKVKRKWIAGSLLRASVPRLHSMC